MALPTFPAQRFVQAGGLTVVHDGVHEYELTDVADGRAYTLAVTVLRATGLLSQAPMATRPLPAGPLVPTEGAQLQRRVTFTYAVVVGADVDPFARADEVLVPLLVAGASAEPIVPGGMAPAVTGEVDLPATGTALEVTGAEVTAVVREGDGLVVRVHNPGDTATEVGLGGRRGWLVDLRGRPLEPVEGGFTLRPRGIATVALSG